MDRVQVSSSNLLSVGYNSKTMVLEVEFKNRSIYQYFGIPSNIYSGLMSAKSHGRYFHAYIKKGRYQFKQIK